jgi:glycosyltransferase involved in cell wall biosynthesis
MSASNRTAKKIAYLDENGVLAKEHESYPNSKFLMFFPGNYEITGQSIDPQLFEAFEDPRVVTISLVTPSRDGESKSIHKRVDSPASDFLLVSCAFTDLLGEVNEQNLNEWSDDASFRGLYHTSYTLSNLDLVSLVSLTPRQDHETPFASIDINPESKLDLIIDCSWLGENETGSQTVITNFVSNLSIESRIGKIYLANLPGGLPAYTKDFIDPKRVVIGRPDIGEKADIFWRPCQPDLVFDIFEARSMAKRVVVTYYDLIGYDIVNYHENTEEWQRYRDSQRKIAELSDSVIAISEDVRSQIVSEFGLVNPKRVNAIGIGVDHIDPGREIYFGNVSSQVLRIAESDFVLCLGTKYRHKNVDFARKVFANLHLETPSLSLVIAGLELDAEKSGIDDEMNSSEIRLESISTADRNHLLKNAKCVLYPTSAEGFGLIPFEASSFGTPTIFTQFGPLMENFPHASMPKSWSIEAYCAAFKEIMSTNKIQKELTEQYEQSAQSRLSWSNITKQLVDNFESTLERPSTFSHPLPFIEVTQQRDEVTQQRDEVTQQRDEVTQQRDEVTQQRDEIYAELNRVYSSISWRITLYPRRLVKSIRSTISKLVTR